MKIKLFGEIAGTALLIYLGTGLLIFNYPYQDMLGPSIGWGLTLAVLVYIFGPLSGAHLNPAVTLVMYLTKRMSAKEGWLYVSAQIVGGILGEFAILGTVWSISQHSTNSWQSIVERTALGATLYPHLSPLAAFLTETGLTSILCLIILVLNHAKTNVYAVQSPIAVGFTIFTAVMVGGNLTGASLNPIRSLFPALAAGGRALNSLGVYLVAPLAGACLAALIHHYILNDSTTQATGH